MCNLSLLVVGMETTASFETALSSISFNRQDDEREVDPSHSFRHGLPCYMYGGKDQKDAPLGEYLSSSCFHITTKILESSSTVTHVDLCVVVRYRRNSYMYRTSFCLRLAGMLHAYWAFSRERIHPLRDAS